MQFERNALSPTSIITPQSSFHSAANLNALKYNLFQQNLNDNSYVKTPSTTSSEEGNSPTELNNCRRILEKPPLVSTIHCDVHLMTIAINIQFLLSFLLKVKRLTMGILRLNDDSRPLVHNKSSSITSSDSIQTISDGYVNEAICDSEKLITSKFGDSCKQSFNHQTFHMHYPLSSLNNAIPLTTLKRSSSQTSSNIITTSATVHTSEKSPSMNTCYNNANNDYNETNFCEFDYKRNFNTAPPSPTSGKNLIPPILPLRNDALSLAEQNDLKGAPWFQAGLPREISLEILSRQNPGAFLVRQSESKMGCFALSLRVPPPAPKVAHYLIMRTQRGFKIKVRIKRSSVRLSRSKFCNFHFNYKTFSNSLFLFQGIYERIYIVASTDYTSFRYERASAHPTEPSTSTRDSTAPRLGRLRQSLVHKMK